MEATLKEPTVNSIPSWGALLAIGVLILVAGILAIALPAAAALAADFALGWIALFVGALQLVHAYQMRHEPGVGWRVAAALLNVALGVLLLAFPLQGVLALALLFGALVLVIGIADIVLALRMRPLAGWGWMLGFGIVSVAAGILLAFTWPLSSFWVLGFYVGVSMISGGVWRIALALALRRRHQPSA